MSDYPEWQIVAESRDGNEAIDAVRSLQPDLLVLDLSMPGKRGLQPDLVILDVSMPGKDGLQVLRELATDGTAVKVLVMTMHESKELIDIASPFRSCRLRLQNQRWP